MADSWYHCNLLPKDYRINPERRLVSRPSRRLNHVSSRRGSRHDRQDSVEDKSVKDRRRTEDSRSETARETSTKDTKVQSLPKPREPSAPKSAKAVAGVGTLDFEHLSLRVNKKRKCSPSSRNINSNMAHRNLFGVQYNSSDDRNGVGSQKAKPDSPIEPPKIFQFTGQTSIHAEARSTLPASNTSLEITLARAFPSVQAPVIRAILRASDGNFERACEALLGMCDEQKAEPSLPSQPPSMAAPTVASASTMWQQDPRISAAPTNLRQPVASTSTGRQQSSRMAAAPFLSRPLNPLQQSTAPALSMAAQRAADKTYTKRLAERDSSNRSPALNVPGAYPEVNDISTYTKRLAKTDLSNRSPALKVPGAYPEVNDVSYQSRVAGHRPSIYNDRGWPRYPPHATVRNPFAEI